MLEKTARAVYTVVGERNARAVFGGGRFSLTRRPRCGESFHRWV